MSLNELKRKRQKMLTYNVVCNDPKKNPQKNMIEKKSTKVHMYR